MKIENIHYIYRQRKIIFNVDSEISKNNLIRLFFCAPKFLQYKLYIKHCLYLNKKYHRQSFSFKRFKQSFKYLQIDIVKKGYVSHSQYCFKTLVKGKNANI